MPQVTVTVYKSRAYDLPGTATDLIAFLESKLVDVPREFRGSVQVEFEVEDDYGSPWIAVCIYYHRPETDEERKHRESLDTGRRAAVEAGEKALLKTLLARYGNPDNT